MFLNHLKLAFVCKYASYINCYHIYLYYYFWAFLKYEKSVTRYSLHLLMSESSKKSLAVTITVMVLYPETTK